MLRTLREVNADSNRARNSLLPRNETTTLKHLHHLIDTRRRNEEMSLDVRLCRRPAEASDVLRDETEVLELSLGGLGGSTLYRSRLRLLDSGNEFFGAGFQYQSLAIREVDAEPLLAVGGGVQEGLAMKTLCERFGGHGSRWHGFPVFSKVWSEAHVGNLHLIAALVEIAGAQCRAADGARSQCW
jgi:hypothetical protein